MVVHIYGLPVEMEPVLALCEKYGWQMHTLDFFSRLGGKINQREFIRIELKNY